MGSRTIYVRCGLSQWKMLYARLPVRVGALLAKIDIHKAHRNIPVQMLLGMMWEGSLFVDSALPFGLSSASKNLHSSCRCGKVDCAKCP